jgi:tRNA pseudouridine32 synthase/23S rRNA pseudouridine746 synthase
LEDAKQNLEQFTNKINQLKEERKEKSAALQRQLFTEYAFLNKNKELKSLAEIFNGNPPAGSGECAAPKLLHYAFQYNLKPIAMGENRQNLKLENTNSFILHVWANANRF